MFYLLATLFNGSNYLEVLALGAVVVVWYGVKRYIDKQDSKNNLSDSKTAEVVKITKAIKEDLQENNENTISVLTSHNERIKNLEKFRENHEKENNQNGKDIAVIKSKLGIS